MVFPTALVGIDGGPGGRDALTLARQLAGSTVLAHLHQLDRDAPAQALALLRAEAERAGLHGDEVALAELNGWPGDGLRELAARRETPLIVVGSSRRRGLGRLVHGDDVRATLRAAETAVAVAPAGWSDGARPLRRIGVGWTGDPASEAALSLATSLADGAPVRAVEAVVLPTPTPGMRGLDAVAAAWYPGTQEDVERAQERLDARGLDGRATAGFGVPVLEDFAQELDLLVIGHVPRGVLFRWLVGSTADGLVRTLSCPLLVAAPVAPGPGDRRQAEDTASR